MNLVYESYLIAFVVGTLGDTCFNNPAKDCKYFH